MPRTTNFLLLIVLILGAVSCFPFDSPFEARGNISLFEKPAHVRRDSTNLACGGTCAACLVEEGCTSGSLPSKRSLCRRDIPWIETGNSSSPRLWKREFEIPHPDDIGLFVEYLANQQPAIDIAPKRRGSDISFTTLQPFSQYPNSRLIMTMADGVLTGCTVLTIVSARAVYMGHFWQSLGFQNYADAEDAANGYSLTPANFQKNVANLIQGTKPTYKAGGAALDPTLFTGPDDFPYAAIMTPYIDENDVNSLYFPDKVDQMKAIVQGLIPGVRVDVYPYFAKNEEIDGALDDGEGRAVFEYDPNADGEGNPDWRLWYETTFEQGSRLGQRVQ